MHEKRTAYVGTSTTRGEFDIFISQFVLDEAAAGDEEAAARRIAALHEAALLDVTEDAILLADDLTNGGGLPFGGLRTTGHLHTVGAGKGLEIMEADPIVEEIHAVGRSSRAYRVTTSGRSPNPPGPDRNGADARLFEGRREAKSEGAEGSLVSAPGDAVRG